MFKRRERDGIGAIDTLIGRRVKVHGDVEFTGGLHVDGTVLGGVRALEPAAASLSVSEHGVIEGSVEARNVVANGLINGDILASGRVVLGARARVHGDVHYAVIEMAPGAEISGKLVKWAAPAAQYAGVKESS